MEKVNDLAKSIAIGLSAVAVIVVGFVIFTFFATNQCGELPTIIGPLKIECKTNNTSVPANAGDTPVIQSSSSIPQAANSTNNNQSKNQVPPVNNVPGLCPSSAQEAQALFGGSSVYWRPLKGYEKYAWKYGPAPASPISNFIIPEGMKGDWWDNFNSFSRTGPAQVGYASEATIWCVPAN